MTKRNKLLDFFPWQGRKALILLVTAIFVNIIHYSIFRDSNYLFKFNKAQLGFIAPPEVTI